jgi:FGGY-family pentulose kinase
MTSTSSPELRSISDHRDESFFIGIDVGTGSARAGVFSEAGKMLATASRKTAMWRPQAKFVEQSSENIWQSCVEAVRAAVSESGIDPARVRGIGFDATCSLVALDASGRPVSVSPTGRDEQNIIVWMDHRAVEQAARINATGHDVLRYVGGVISPEMQSPKLLWLKENSPSTWTRAAYFFDLPDFLTFRATGDTGRSLCSLVCKWTYLGHESAENKESVGRWSRSYWETIGLGDLVQEDFKRIGTCVRPIGAKVGNGLSEQAASELGLPAGTSVGTSMIDAHAGGIRVLGGLRPGEALTQKELETRLALIGGTSSCHMAVSGEPRFVEGVWGPYFSAMIPNLWLTEGGQSATGALIDHVVFTHAAAAEGQEKAKQEGLSIYEFLNRCLADLATDKAEFPAALTRELHVQPDFHGNRSPRADPSLCGMISGLKLSAGLEDLARLYLATIQAVAYGTRHIIECLNAKGYRISTLFACGGGTKNPVFLRELADATGCTVVLPLEPEAVLLGSAILGAVAANAFPSILDAMGAMSRIGQVIEPSRGAVARYHEAKYAVFKKLYDDQISYRRMMART